MAPGRYEELVQLLNFGGGQHDDLSAEQLEQLYQEVASQVQKRLQSASHLNILSLFNARGETTHNTAPPSLVLDS